MRTADWLLFYTVVVGVLYPQWCKEEQKAAPQNIQEFNDATVPENKTDPGIILRNITTEISSTRSAEQESSTGNKLLTVVENNSTEPSKPSLNNGKDKLKTEKSENSSRRITIIDPISVKLLVAEENGIRANDFAKSQKMSIINQTNIKAYSIDFHYKKRLLFYAAFGKIIRHEVVSRLWHGINPMEIVSGAVNGAVALAVDWVNDKIYWITEKYQTVEMADLDGGNRTLLVDTFDNIKYPNNIAVDPYEGYLFLVNNYSIYRMNLDGSNLIRLSLAGDGERGVKCLTLDPQLKKIFYSGKSEDFEKGKPYLASCDYEGGQGQDIQLPYKWNDIFSLGVHNNVLYWGHYRPEVPDTIWSSDLSKLPGSSVGFTVRPQLKYKTETQESGIWSFRVYHPGVQHNSKNSNCSSEKDN